MYTEYFTIGATRVKQEPVTPRPRKHPPLSAEEKERLRRVRKITAKLSEICMGIALWLVGLAIAYPCLLYVFTHCLTH